jgi:hypothetical protein
MIFNNYYIYRFEIGGIVYKGKIFIWTLEEV